MKKIFFFVWLCLTMSLFGQHKGWPNYLNYGGYIVTEAGLIPTMGGALKLLVDPGAQFGLSTGNVAYDDLTYGANLVTNGNFDDFTFGNHDSTKGHWIMILSIILIRLVLDIS